MAEVAVEKSTESFDSLWITDFFHSFPHWDWEFNQVNSTFDPENESYRQALYVWAASPLLLCAFFWLIYTIYFIVRCCQKPKSAKTRGSACPKIFAGFMIFLTVCFLGVGFYENEQAHGGVEKLCDAVVNVNSTVDTASEEIHFLDRIAADVAGRLSDMLRIECEKVPDVPVRNELLAEIDKMGTWASRVQGYLKDVEIRGYMGGVDDFIDVFDDVEYYRWLVTIIVLCLFILILLVKFIGLMIRSCTLLICTTCLAIFCSLLLWISCGVYLGSSVALGDFCANPDTYVLSLVDDPDKKAVLKAYITCEDPQQPYEQDIVNAQVAITKAVGFLNSTLNKAKPYDLPGLDPIVNEVNRDFQDSMGNLSSLLQNVGQCTHLHKEYIRALDGSCDTTFTSAAFLTILTLLISLCCVVLIFLSSCVWRQYRRHRSPLTYEPVDDTDPFLPHPPPYDADYGAMRFSSPTPWSERGGLQTPPGPSLRSEQGVMTFPRHHPIPMDESPPPAYQPGRFILKQADLGRPT